MSEEEKETIEMLEKFITEHKLYNIKQSDDLELNIKKVLNLIEKQQKEIYCLKNKVHISKCSICGKEFEHKKSDCKFCKDCRKKAYKAYNHNYFKNMSEDKKRKRREYSKLYMRRIRGCKKENE